LEILKTNIKMTEELNLSELFANFVKFISRNSKLLLVIVVIGVAGVIGYQKLKTPYYETKAICMSGISEYERQDQIEDLSQRTAIDVINHLQINVENKDYSALATLLHVDENVAATIKKIEAEQLYQQDMNEKFYALNKFEIVLTTFDNMRIDQLQKGLIYYFSNNDFIKNYHANYLASNITIISDINTEIEALGDMRVEGVKNNLDISSVNIVSGQNGTVISNQIVVLSQLREDIKTKQALLKHGGAFGGMVSLVFAHFRYFFCSYIL
jgi:predicted negative regulator of RcsB-dependent stress response